MEWTYYDSLTPQMPAVADRQMPTVSSRTDVTNPELDMYQTMVRQKQRAPPVVGGQMSGNGHDVPAAAGAEAVFAEKVQRPVKAADISDPSNVSDFWFIVLAVLFVDVVVIFLTRFYPDIFGRNLNRWYDLFGLNAVLADVLIIVLGFVIARYVYRDFIAPKFLDGEWSPLAFTGTVVGVQLIHDILFYLCVILPIPRGHNLMMDVFKDYASAGGKILFGDALMMIASTGIAIVLKGTRPEFVAIFGFLTTYALPYILYTRNQFTVLR